jgi:glycosyltransferase involved in cell wall biosynthesis
MSTKAQHVCAPAGTAAAGLTTSSDGSPSQQPRRLLFNVNVIWFFMSHRLEIARAAQAAGYEVHISGDVESADEVQALRAEGMIFHKVTVQRGSLGVIADLRYLYQMISLIRQVRPDLVHNVTVKPVVYGSIAAVLLRVGGVINAVSGLGYAFAGTGLRAVMSSIVRLAYRVALRHEHVRVIFQNRDDMRELIQAGAVVAAQACLIRGSGVDLTIFAPSPEPPGTIQVLLPARMLRDKGVLEFAEAARLLRDRGCRAKFLLAGRLDPANPTGLSLEELSDIQQASGVQWLGNVNDMPALYWQVHVICLPSYREGLPKSLIEACAVGRPIVTTDVPGCRDVVTDGLNGLLVPVRDAQALARSLETLVEDRDLRLRFGANAHQRAVADFDVRQVVAQTLELYRSVLT